KAVLLIGNDPTNQNPFVAWQIRAGIRHHGLKLFVINSRDIKLKRQAKNFVKVAAGQEAAAVRYLATGEGQITGPAADSLNALKFALSAESDVAIVFGAELTGSAIFNVVALGSNLQGKTR